MIRSIEDLLFLLTWLALVRALYLLHKLRRNLIPYRVLGGVMTQLGDPMLPIQPGNSPKFVVTPAFNGASFTLDGTRAGVATSDETDAPAVLDLANDPQGLTFVINLTPNVVIDPAGKPITVTWSYTNLDGTMAVVNGTITENGIVDDVTGGTFSQVE